MDSWIAKKLGGRDIGSVLVDELEFSVRALNCFKNLGIRTVGDLASTTEAELLRSPNFGHHSLGQTKELLGNLGVKLGSTTILSTEQQMNRAMARARAAALVCAEAVLEVQRLAKRMVDQDLEDIA